VPKKTSPRLAAARSAHHGERSGRTRAPHSGKITKKFGHSRRQPPPGSRKAVRSNRQLEAPLAGSRSREDLERITQATGVPEELQSNARIGVDLPVGHLESNESDMLAWVREYFVREQITGPDPDTDLKVAWRDNQDFACVAFKEYQRLKTAQERKRWEDEGQWMISVPGSATALSPPRSGRLSPPAARFQKAEREVDRRHPAASSVPRLLTICLQWLLFQQMHYHGSESRVMPLRGIELF
jgi:hypothetical protein